MGNCISGVNPVCHLNRKITIAFLGVDGAGKTTIINALLGELIDVAPTVGFNEVTVKHENCEITIFDLGGGQNIRDIWKNYLAELYGVIYVVDSSTRDRTDEIKENLTNLLQNPQVSGKPLLLLANKQDIEGHMEDSDIHEKLALEPLVNQTKCPYKLVTCSAIKGTGKKIIKNGLTWLCNIIGQMFQKLEERIAKDMEEVKRKRQEENQLRAERVRKLKEERERQGAEMEVKKEEEEDMLDGDPFRRLDINELDKKKL